MQAVTLIGIDLGKHSFHVHGQDPHGKALLRMKFNRKQLIEFFAKFQTCAVVMEACAGAHHMARRLAGYGHEVKLDAEAICEAARPPSMRFVTPKTESQQCLSALHRVRESLVRERVMASNQIHGFLLEFGISLPVGHAVIRRLPSVLAEQTLPARLVTLLERLHSHFCYLDEQIVEIEKELNRQLQDEDLGQRLTTIPGVGPLTASVLAAEVGDGKQYRCGQDFAASLELVPRQCSTGGKNNLLGISKRGDKHMRRLLVQCARAYMLRLERQTDQLAQWVRSMLTRRHSNVVACALANKLARTAWAIAAHHTEFQRQEAVRTT